MFVAVAFALAAVTATDVTLSSDSVDAVGEQQVVLKVGTPGMVHFAVDSVVGTSCTLVDHLRGPFLDVGETGKTSCVVDTLLDAGLYKVRLHSPVGRPGTPKPPRAKLSVAAFVDDSPAPVTLQRAQPVTATLRPGHQIVRWLKLATETEVVIDVVGRTAGDVRLWRDGAFVVEGGVDRSVVRGESGRPRWRHHFERLLEAGEYAVVVSGANPQRFSSGSDDDTVQLSWEGAFVPPSGVVELVIPPWGFVQASSRGTTATIALDAASTTTRDAVGDVVIKGTSIVRRGDDARRNGSSFSCAVAANAVVRGCVVVGPTGDQVLGTAWEITGPAGARVRLVTVTAQAASTLPRLTGTGTDPAFTVARGDRVEELVVSALPPDPDGPPLSCRLERVDGTGTSTQVLGVDAPKLGWTQAWQRRFNVDGGGTSLWFLVERAGVYGVSSETKLGAGCDVYTLTGMNRARIDGADVGKGCNVNVALPAGLVEIALSGGSAGIENFRIGQVGLAALLGSTAPAPLRAGCAFSSTRNDGGALKEALDAGTYRVRTSTTSRAALLAIGRAALGADGAPVVVSVTAGTSARVALPAGGAVAVSALSSAGLPRLAVEGGATVDGAVIGERVQPAVLVLTNTSAAAQTVIVAPRTLPPPAAMATPFVATATPLPVVVAGTSRWFDLDASTSRSFLVDVKTTGYYDVQTEGLLSTSCSVRTATTTSLFNGDRNGRGHNCRVEAWLKPGRYLVVVRAEGRSVGRAGLTIVARQALDGGPIVVGDERFVSVPAGQLAKHALTIKRDGPVDIAVTSFDAELQCRLDDDDGWPVFAVPHACAVTQPLAAGRYALVVLPLGVDSQRSVRSMVPTTTTILSGNVVHPLALNTPATAALGADGSDSFRFSLVAGADVGITLTGGMQGRLRRQGNDGKAGDVEHTIAPLGGSSFSIRSSDEDGGEGDADDGEEDSAYEGEDVDGEGSGDGYEGGGERDDGASSRERLQAAAVHRAPPPPAGEALWLDAGTWVLETEHSRGDVGISYTVAVATSTLLPGARLTVQAPAVLDVRAPATSDAGLVRIKTRGGTDVACRLVDDDGVLIASSQRSGDDWNCALAVPLLADRHYRLFVDAEVLVPGPTEVSAEFLEAKSTGPLQDGNAFRVIGKVARADVVPVANMITSIELAATEGVFSCALFDSDGRVLDSAVAVKRCPLLVWGGDDPRPFSLLLWTADRPAALKAKVTTLSPAGGLLAGTAVDDNRVLELKVPRAGRFATAPNARCIAKKSRGVLLPCATTTALDPQLDGDTVLVGVPRGEKATIDFAEVVADPGLAGSDTRRLTAHVDVERQHTSTPRLHLVDVVARAGSVGGPACAIDGGVRVVDGRRCIAASSVGTDSSLRLWTKAGAGLDTTVRRASLELTSTTTALPVSTTLKGTSRFALPAGPFRLDAALPADAWAVLVDDRGVSVDVCGPAIEVRRARATGLSRCVLRGRGGSVVVDGAGAARFDLVRFTAAEDRRPLTGLREVLAAVPGRERLQLQPIDKARVVVVEGSAVVGCRQIADNGDAIEGCLIEVPAKRSPEIVVEHKAGPWRAIVATTALPASASAAQARAIDTALSTSRLGAVSTMAQASTVATALPLQGTATSTRVKLAAPAMLRVRADSGVCGVVAEGSAGGRVVVSGGDGRGCDLSTALPAGEHVVAVRGFAGAPLTGGVTITTETLAVLGEGVGAEVLVLPGETRLLRVPLAKDGELGIGIQVDAEVLQCALLDPWGVVVADGCQLFGRFSRGDYTLRVSVDADDVPRRFRPVVFGLKGAEIDVPDAFLDDFFRRVPRPTASTTSPSTSPSTSTPTNVTASEVR